MKKGGLGRNLEALLGSSAQTLATKKTAQPEASPSNEAMTCLSVDKLRPGRYQPRQDFADESLQELAQSIKNQGIIQPLVVRSISADRYEIIAGERRWRAAKLAALQEVPVLIRELSDQDAMAIALIENLQREDLNPIEQAIALQRLQEEFNLTQQDMANALGSSRSSIGNCLRLLNLSPDVKRNLQHGDIEIGHAKVLLSLPENQQSIAAKIIINRQLTVRETEQLVQKMKRNVDKPVDKLVDNNTTHPIVERHQESLQILAEQLQSKINLSHNKKGHGKLFLSYTSETELANLLGKLLNKQYQAAE